MGCKYFQRLKTSLGAQFNYCDLITKGQAKDN